MPLELHNVCTQRRRWTPYFPIDDAQVYPSCSGQYNRHPYYASETARLTLPSIINQPNSAHGLFLWERNRGKERTRTPTHDEAYHEQTKGVSKNHATREGLREVHMAVEKKSFIICDASHLRTDDVAYKMICPLDCPSSSILALKKKSTRYSSAKSALSDQS